MKQWIGLCASSQSPTFQIIIITVIIVVVIIIVVISIVLRKAEKLLNIKLVRMPTFQLFSRILHSAVLCCN